MSSDVEIHLIAYDEASSVIESVGSNLSVTFTDVEGKTQSLANTTDEATGKMASDYEHVETASSSLTNAQEKTSMGIGQTALSMNNLALSGATLFMSFERVENAQVAVDRANLMVQRSTESLEHAQTTYNDAVAKYGVDSAQAKDAADKLRIAQEAHNVALERADMANRNMNNTMMFSVLTVIPSLISLVTGAISVKEMLTGATAAEAAAEDIEAASETAAAGTTGILSGAMTALGGVLDFLAANPIMLVVAAIAAIILALKYAYDHSEAFRNIINAVGKVLSDFFTPIVQAVTGALTWLWNNVLVPLGQFIVAYFKVTIELLTFAWNLLNQAIAAVANGLKWLWDNIFVPLGSFLLTVFINGVLVPLKNIWDAISAAVTWLWKNVLEPLANFLTGVLKVAFDVIMVPINAFMGAINWIISAAKTVSDVLGGIGKALMGLCFAHATPAAVAFNETLASSMELTDKLTGNVANLGDSLKGLTGMGAEAMPLMGGGIGAGAVPTPTAKALVTVNITAPLVNVEGSADRATVDLASKQVLESLKSVLVEPTSAYAAATQKRIRKGAVFT